MLDRIDTLHLVERASTLSERIAAARARRATASVTTQPAARDPSTDAAWRMWSERVAEGDAERFARRLGWDDVASATAAELLRPVRADPADPLPEWTTLLHEALGAAHAVDLDATDRARDPTAPVAFEEIVLPFVAVARARLGSRVPEHLALLGDDAHGALERALLHHLSYCCDQTLDLELTLFRACHPALALEHEAADAPAAQYAAFVRHTLVRLPQLLLEYSALARLVATRTLFWVQVTEELLVRLAADRVALAETFGIADACVVHAEGGVSDSHGGGHGVMVLRFASGGQLVYKRRGLGMDHAFAGVVAWLNGRCTSLPLRAARVLDRGAYGWAEHVAAAPCGDAAAAARYHERAGMLLCLAYALGGTDLHSENVVAAGEDPVLVDLEMLFVPRGDPTARAEVPDTVLRTNLLPFRFLAGGRSVADGGFSAPGVDEPPAPRRAWVRVNTDAMARRATPRAREPGPNVPRLRGRPLSPQAFAADLARGFARMYAALVRDRDAFVAPDGPLAPFAREPVRLLLRGTATYGAALRRSLHPRVLRTGADRGIELETLLRTPLASPARERFWLAYRAEQRALEQGDVPRFTVDACGTALRTTHCGDLSGFLPRSGHDEAMARIRRLGPDDLACQLALIRVALAERPGHHAAVAAPRVSMGDEHGGEHAPLGTGEALDEAVRLADVLRRAGRRDASGHPQWLAMTADPAGQRAYRFGYVDESLYAGRAGIGLFLAAVAAATDEPARRDDARRCLTLLAARLSDRAQAAAFVDECGIGALHGVAGAAYVLARAGAWLDAPELLAAATRAVALVTPARIAADRALDVFRGAAGVVLALLAVHERVPGARRAATLCGRRLIRARERESSTGVRAWRTGDARAWSTGFAHGASGIAAALGRLHVHATEPVHRSAARDATLEALAFERALVTRDGTGWHAAATPESIPALGAVASPGGWCDGALGIGLGRVAAAESLGVAAVRDDLARAVAASRRARLDGPDHVCCGSLGRVELLLAAGGATDDAALVGEAYALAGRVVGRARRTASYGTTIPNAYAPAFFQGIAGIGYTLLRLHDPARFPSVLLLA